MFSINRATTPDFSFEESPETLTNDRYTPTAFTPLNEEYDDPPTDAPSPSSLGSPPPKIMMGNDSRFKSGKETSHTNDSLDISTPEKKVGFFNRKKIKKPKDYEQDNTDWQYNSFLRLFEYKPGMDFYDSRGKCSFEMEMETSQNSENDSE